MGVTPLQAATTDLKHARLVFVFDGRRRRGKDGKNAKDVATDVPEAVTAAGRKDDALASTELSLLAADVNARLTLEDDDHLLDAVVAVRRGAGSGLA
jgi:hypothetical protein